MPELPEVETVVKTLRPLMLDQKIKAIEIFHPKMVKPNVSIFTKSLVGKSIKAIERLGKFILFFLSDDLVVISHLRMEGKYLELKDENAPLSRFARMVFSLSDGRRIIYDDMRKFGTFELTTQSTYLQHQSLKGLGKEPLHDLDSNSIYLAFKKANRPIKSILLDQRILLGIGNIYADEILFAAKIHPLTIGKNITLDQTKAILKHAKRILHQAIADGGTRIRTYQSGQKIDGEFVTKIKVYGRDGKPCKGCHHRLDKIMVGGRGTHYCPHCQHHPRLPMVIGVTGEIATGKSTLIQVGMQLGIPAIEADKFVHQFYQTKQAIGLLKKVFPESIVNGKIDRGNLLWAMVKDRRRYDLWIKILFPIIKQMIYQALIKCKAPLVLLEVPLLFQGKIDAFTDVILGVESPQALQRLRLHERNPENVEPLWILNERNLYRQFLPFIDQRLVNDSSIKIWKDRVEKTLKTYLAKTQSGINAGK